MLLAGLVQLDLQPQTLTHGGSGDGVHVVDDLGRVDLAERFAGSLGHGGQAVGEKSSIARSSPGTPMAVAVSGDSAARVST